MLVVHWRFWFVYLMGIEGGRPALLTEDIEGADASIKRWLQSTMWIEKFREGQIKFTWEG